MPEGLRILIPFDADPAAQAARRAMDEALRRYLEATTTEQRAAHWKAFKCGGCALRTYCPTSPVCPAMED